MMVASTSMLFFTYYLTGKKATEYPYQRIQVEGHGKVELQR